MPHMRRGPDTWHVSQTRRCVESSLLSPFKPREPAERRVDHPPPTRGLVGRAGALAPRGSRELDTWRTWAASFSLGGRLTWRTSSTSNFAGNLQGNAIEASAFIVNLRACIHFLVQARSLVCGTLSGRARGPRAPRELPSDGRRGGPREPPEPATSPRVGLTRPRGKTPKEPKGYPQEPQEANHVRHPSNSTRGPHQRAT